MEFEKFLVSVILNKEQHCRVCLRTDKERRLVSADTYRKVIGRILSLKNYGVQKEAQVCYMCEALLRRYTLVLDMLVESQKFAVLLKVKPLHRQGAVLVADRELLDAFESNLKMHQKLTKYCITETLTIDSTDKDPIDLTNDYQPLNPNIAGIDNNIILIPSGAKFIDYQMPQNQANAPNLSGTFQVLNQSQNNTIQLINQSQNNSIQLLNQTQKNSIQLLNQTQNNAMPVLNQLPNTMKVLDQASNPIQFLNQTANLNFQVLGDALNGGQVFGNKQLQLQGVNSPGGWQLIQIIDPTQQANVASEGNQMPNFMKIVPQTHVKTTMNNITQLNKTPAYVNTTASNIAQVKVTPSNYTQVKTTASSGAQVSATASNVAQGKGIVSSVGQVNTTVSNVDQEQSQDAKKLNRSVHRVEDKDCIAIIETDIDDDRPAEPEESEDGCIIPDTFVDLSDDSNPKSQQFIVPVALSKLRGDAAGGDGAFAQLPSSGEGGYYGALSGPVTSTVPIHDPADVSVVKSIEGSGQYVIVGGTNLMFVPITSAAPAAAVKPDSKPEDLKAIIGRRRAKAKPARPLTKLMPKAAPPAPLPKKAILRDLLADPPFEPQEQPQPKESNWLISSQEKSTNSNASDDAAPTSKPIEVIEVDCSTIESQMEEHFKLPVFLKNPRVYGQPIKPVPKDRTVDWEDRIPMEVITYADGSPMPQQSECGLGKISEVYSEAPTPSKKHKL